jgi:hypothetical protein
LREINDHNSDELEGVSLHLSISIPYTSSMEEEPADVCGRREGCFIDHRSPAFSFRGALKGLRMKAVSGIIHEPGLSVASLPLSKIKLDVGYDLASCQLAEDLCHSSSDKPPTPSSSKVELVRRKEIRLELPELASKPDDDFEEYTQLVRSRLHINLSTQWLPLSSIKSEEDEGLHFPRHAGRLRALLLRELEREKVSVSPDLVDPFISTEPVMRLSLPDSTYYNVSKSSRM